MPRTILRCTTETLDAPIMDKVSHFVTAGHCSAGHWLYKVYQPHFSFSLRRQLAGWRDESGGETQSHGQHEGEFDHRLFCCSERIFGFWLPENDLVPLHRLVSTCHDRISAWTLATAQRSLCTLAAVCSLPLTSWQRCGPRTGSLC